MLSYHASEKPLNELCTLLMTSWNAQTNFLEITPAVTFQIQDWTNILNILV